MQMQHTHSTAAVGVPTNSIAGTHANMEATHYRKLLIMAVLSYIAMYILMYSMVDRLANVYNNINQVYMAGLMASPMVIIEVLLMSMMYKNKKLNALIIIGSLIIGIACYAGIRQQAGVGDKQFLRSMIPHHAAAVLMVEKTEDIKDPQIKQLMQNIITSQQQEIADMKAKLKELDK